MMKPSSVSAATWTRSPGVGTSEGDSRRSFPDRPLTTCSYRSRVSVGVWCTTITCIDCLLMKMTRTARYCTRILDCDPLRLLAPRCSGVSAPGLYSNPGPGASRAVRPPTEPVPTHGWVRISDEVPGPRVAATDMRGRGTQRLAGSRRADRSRHGFGEAEAGLRSGVERTGIEPVT